MRYLLLLLVVAVTLARRTHEESIEEESHDVKRLIDFRCCRMLGGVPCGIRFKTCCSGGCRPGFFGGVKCIGPKIEINEDVCPTSCKNVCREMGGQICGTSIFSQQCCHPQYCRGLVDRQCDAGMQIPLPKCGSGASFGNWRI